MRLSRHYELPSLRLLERASADQKAAGESSHAPCPECDGDRCCVVCEGEKIWPNGTPCLDCAGGGRCVLCKGEGQVPRRDFTLLR